MFAGEIVRRGGSSADDGKALRLLAAGCACLAAGLALSFVVPINKALWSPSFTLVAGGISFIAFASFYWVVDVRKCRRWTPFFTVIGMNSITIYMAQSVIGFWHARDFLFGGLASLFPGDWKNVALKLSVDSPVAGDFSLELTVGDRRYPPRKVALARGANAVAAPFRDIRITGLYA